MILPSSFQVSDEVTRAIALNLPVVALESTVITHGLPQPDNRILAEDMESEIRNQGATPATIAVLDGKILVGLGKSQLERLAKAGDMEKISVRDLSQAVVKKKSGGTTVAATIHIAQSAQIRVFATGGIGGVHRDAPFDISADLPQLAKTPLIVVCSGAKSILDLPATLEYLEMVSVPVVGYQTDDFPAFYSRSSGLKNSVRAETPREVVELARAHWELGLQSAVLVVNPPPERVALPNEEVESALLQSLKEAKARGVRGQQVTPFLLKRISELTLGTSLVANLALLRSNASLAAQIACNI